MTKNQRKTRSASLITFALLFAVILITSIAAMPATLTAPNAPTAAATANAGEIQVRWQTVAGAQFYTVGWINRNDYLQIGQSGDWLSAFHYATVPASRTSYTVSGLKAGEEYWAIIGARRERDGGEPTSWSASWSGLVMTSGQHGGGFCPITGLPLPPGGYLSVGDTASIGTNGKSFKLDSANKKSTIMLQGTNYRPFGGRQFINICATVRASNNYREVYFIAGKEYNVDTDAGIGFADYDDSITSWLDLDTIPAGQTGSACEVWNISANAKTVIIAVDKWQANPALYKVDLP